MRKYNDSMGLRFCVLGSSSSGNAIWVASATTQVLVDAGLSARTIEHRLDALGTSVSLIDAVVLTHEHADHVHALPVLHRRYGVRVYANEGTREALRIDPRFNSLRWVQFITGQGFRIGDLQFWPFSVPHDACDPVGFVVTDGSVDVGIATDLGTPTELVCQRLRPCRALVLEANHDEMLLRNSNRPWSLKQRILSRHGHLSNADAADLIALVAGRHLSDVFLAHLSQECNHPTYAEQAVCELLQERGCSHVRVHLTYPDRPSKVWDSCE